MQKHALFDLLAWDNDELESAFGSPVRARNLIAEWPLSMVESVSLDDGRQVVCKSQREPTVEHLVYERCRSGLLPTLMGIWQDGPHVNLMLRRVRGTPLEQLKPDPSMALEIGRLLSRGVGRDFSLSLPVHLDISTPDRWLHIVDETITWLDELTRNRVLERIASDEISGLREIATRSEIVNAFSGPPAYLHADLSADNVIVTLDGFRVVDWQRPARGPADLDLVRLLDSLGYNPERHLPRSLVWIERFLSIRWFAECTRQWIPGARATYDRQIADIIHSMEESRAASAMR